MITMMTSHDLESSTNHDQRIHHNHCLTQVRQYVRCAGNLTPIPLIYFNAPANNHVQSDFTPHTCRNFQKIRDWSLKVQESNTTSKLKTLSVNSGLPTSLSLYAVNRGSTYRFKYRPAIGNIIPTQIYESILSRCS